MEERECTLGEEAEGAIATEHCEVEDTAIEEFWEPPNEAGDLYDQLFLRKYREIPRKTIV